MTIYELKNSMSIIGNQLKKVEQEISDKAANPAISMEEINNLKTERDNLKARFNLIKEQHDDLVQEEENNIKAQENKLKYQQTLLNNQGTEDAELVNAKAEFYKNVIRTGNSSEINSALKGFGTSTNGGEKFLPSTMSNELLTEPTVKNPLREVSTFTNISGLEVPKIDFTIDEYDFLDEDDAIAKEIQATGDIVQFDRNKIKIFVPITDTLMHGTNTNLVETVENALKSGLAAKEKQLAFLPASNGSAKVGKSESFYKCTPAIKKITAGNMFDGIMEALGDLDDKFSENATVIMKKAEYYKMIKEFANNSTSLYMAQPESIIGCKVIFCDKAEKPIVGDFRYSHFNYDPNMIYDRDKNARTGIYDFVLTGWVDHKIKLKSAFRIVEVTSIP